MVKVTAASPGTGSVTVSTAVSGFRTFAQGYNSADATVAGVRIEDASDATIWEICENCAYTHSGTTLTRGTRKDSSTGGAVNFTGSVIVSVIATAGFGNNAALNHVAGGDADTTMAVGNMYVTDMSGWATADRTYTLPATAAVGDRIGIMVTAGDASHELIIKPNTGDTINGGSAAAEWSRLFITGEVVILRCVTADSAWVVEYDGRKFESCRVDTDGTTASHTRNSSTKINAELATETSDVNAIWDAANKQFIPRRLGRYLMHGHLQMALMGDGQTCVASIWKNGSSIGGGGSALCPAASSYPEADVVLFYDVTTVGDYFELYVYYSDGSTNRSTNSANIYFEATRIGGAA